jgi:hypothetical protein
MTFADGARAGGGSERGINRFAVPRCLCGRARRASGRDPLRKAVTRARSTQRVIPPGGSIRMRMMMTSFSNFGPYGTASTLREGDAGRHTHYRRARRLPSLRSAGATADGPSAEPDDEDDETAERENQRDDTAPDDDGHRSTVEEPTPDRVDAPFQRTTPKKGGVRDPDRSR